MLWYGIVSLFVAGTVFSYMLDGRSGIGSTETTTAVGVGYWAIPVRSLSGFVPETYGEVFVEMDEPGELVVGGTEKMTYIAGVFAAGHSYWKCQSDALRSLPTPCLIVQRSEPVEHEAGEYVHNENAAALNDFIGFRVAERDTTVGKLTFPFHAAGAIIGFIGKVVIWDWNFLEGNAAYVKWFLLWPLSAMTIFAVIRLLIDAASIFSL